MNKEEVNFSLGCLLSITHMEKSFDRGMLFRQKIQNQSQKLHSIINFLTKYDFVITLSVLSVLREIKKIYANTFVLKSSEKILSFECSKNQAKSIKKVSEVLDREFSQKKVDSVAVIQAFLKISLIIFLKRKRLSFLAKKNTNCLTEVIKYFFFFHYLRNQKIQNFQHAIVANDHSPEPLAFIRIMNQKRSKITFLQHGHISRAFPPLFRFNTAILYGRESLEIYESIGKTSKNTFFTGHSYKSAEALKELPKEFDVVIFPNIIDIEKMNHLTSQLIKNQHVKSIFIKAHPAHKIPNKLQDHENIIPIESTNDSRLGSYIGVAGNSSIHIELLAQGVLSVYYDELDSIKSDYYGFVKRGAVLKLSDPLHLTSEELKAFYFSQDWHQNISHFDYAFAKQEELKQQINEIKNYFIL